MYKIHSIAPVIVTHNIPHCDPDGRGHACDYGHVRLHYLHYRFHQIPSSCGICNIYLISFCLGTHYQLHPAPTIHAYVLSFAFVVVVVLELLGTEE